MSRAAALLACVFLTAQARDVPRFATGTAVLTGIVLTDEQNGQPVRGALLNVVGLSDARQLLQVATDDRGRFTVNNLPSGNVRLVASKPGYVTTYYGATQPGSTVGRPIALSNDKSTDVTIRLPRGAVIAGTVMDDTGQPMPSVSVRVQRVTVSPLGQRTLTGLPGPGLPPTDDRGAYRIYGLPAGDYVVVAQPRIPGAGEVRQTTAAELEWAERRIRGATPGTLQANAAAAPEPAQTITYASVYFPGTVSAANAGVVSVAAGQERDGVDLRMQFVATARVEGTVTSPEGAPARGVQILLVPKSEMGNADADRLMIMMEVGVIGGNAVVQTPADGRFSVQNVEPGSYTVLARTGLGAGRGAGTGTGLERSWAMTDIRVDGRDIRNLALRMAPGQSVAGRVVLEGAPPNTPIRIALTLRPQGSKGVGVNAPVFGGGAEADGIFTVGGLIPSPYRVSATATGWTLKSAMLDGRDVADNPFEVRPGEDISGLVLTLTSATTEVSGVLYDGAGRPSGDLSMVLFSTDRTMWFSGSRRVRPAVRPATDGRFMFSGLVAGEYYLAALGEVTPADLANPQFLEQIVPAAIRISVAAGEKKVQDIRIKF